jgi:hypothetical protein
MNATYNNSTYNITGTVTTVDVNISGGSDQVFVIKRLPQIIYLGVDNLYWEDSGSDQAPITTVTHTFRDNNPNKVPSDSTKSFDNNSGASGTFTKIISAPEGYYWDENNLPTITTPNGYSIINEELIGLYDTTLELTISYNSHPGVDTDILFTYDSTSNVILSPTPRDVDFVFTDSDGNISQITETVNDTPGFSDEFQIIISAPDGQRWSTAPVIDAKAGYSYTYQLIEDSFGNNTSCNVTVNYNNFPVSGPINFTYTSAGLLEAVPTTSMEFTKVIGTVGRNTFPVVVDDLSFPDTYVAQPGDNFNFSNTITLTVFNALEFEFDQANTGLLINVLDPTDLFAPAPSIGLSGSGSDIEYTVTFESFNGFDNSRIRLSFNSPSWPSQNYPNLTLSVSAVPQYRLANSIRQISNAYYGPSIETNTIICNGQGSGLDSYEVYSVNYTPTQGDWLFGDAEGRQVALNNNDGTFYHELGYVVSVGLYKITSVNACDTGFVPE